MGYNTDFYGSLDIEPALSRHHYAYIAAFCGSRRMIRDPDKFEGNTADDVRILVGLPKGKDGEFCIGGGEFGQANDPSILNYNRSAPSQPSLWCGWSVGNDGKELYAVDGKSYYAPEWLRYLIDNFFEPWGYKLNGTIDASGEVSGDVWRIVVRDNSVEKWVGKIVYELKNPGC